VTVTCHTAELGSPEPLPTSLVSPQKIEISRAKCDMSDLQVCGASELIEAESTTTTPPQTQTLLRSSSTNSVLEPQHFPLSPQFDPISSGFSIESN